MTIGTKSLLFGAHQVIIHPICVFIAWWKLYGFPRDLRLWIAFIVHDWGYWGKPNMDGKEGETHVKLGAKLMHKWFDKKYSGDLLYDDNKGSFYKSKGSYYWYDFTLYHSRFYAKLYNHPISQLCIADKYAFTIPPKWLYILLASWSGEIYEYMTKGRSSKVWISKSDWYSYVYDFMQNWVKENNKF